MMQCLKSSKYQPILEHCMTEIMRQFAYNTMQQTPCILGYSCRNSVHSHSYNKNNCRSHHAVQNYRNTPKTQPCGLFCRIFLCLQKQWIEESQSFHFISLLSSRIRHNDKKKKIQKFPSDGVGCVDGRSSSTLVDSSKYNWLELTPWCSFMYMRAKEGTKKQLTEFITLKEKIKLIAFPCLLYRT